MDYETKMAELQRLSAQVKNIEGIVNSKANAVSVTESQLRQGVVPNNSAQQLEYNLSNSLGPLLQPGNVGDINSIIWPFYFSTDVPDSPIAQGETFQTGFSVTQEAAFIFMSFVKAVYLVEGEEEDQSWTYLQQTPGVPSAPGLVFNMRDGSSTRQFNNSTPTYMDHCGNPRFPTKFPRPVMLLPNQVFQISFINNHPTNLYVPIITAFGYRMRIDEAQKLLSLVYG